MKTGHPIIKLNNIEVRVCLGVRGCLDYDLSLCMFKWQGGVAASRNANIEWGIGWTVLGLSQALSPSVLARVTTGQPSALAKGTAKVHGHPSPASLKHHKRWSSPEKQWTYEVAGTRRSRMLCKGTVIWEIRTTSFWKERQRREARH